METINYYYIGIYRDDAKENGNAFFYGVKVYYGEENGNYDSRF